MNLFPHTRLCFPLLLAVLFVSGCGSSGDSLDPLDATNAFPTTLSLTTTGVTLSGPVTSGSVTADAVTVEPSVADPITTPPTTATIANGTWSHVISSSSGSALTSQTVRVRWYQAGMQIDQKLVRISP